MKHLLAQGSTIKDKNGPGSVFETTAQGRFWNWEVIVLSEGLWPKNGGLLAIKNKGEFSVFMFLIFVT